MENTCTVHSTKGCVPSGIIFGFHHDGTLCHYIFTGRRISKTTSNDDIVLLKSYELSGVSRYSTGMKVAHFDHNNE